MSKQIKAKNVLCTIDSEGRLKHWHVTSSKCLHTINLTETEGKAAVCMDFSSDGTKFILGSEKRDSGYTVSIYDETQKSIINETEINELKIRSIKYNKTDDNIF